MAKRGNVLGAAAIQAPNTAAIFAKPQNSNDQTPQPPEEEEEAADVQTSKRPDVATPQRPEAATAPNSAIRAKRALTIRLSQDVTEKLADLERELRRSGLRPSQAYQNEIVATLILSADLSELKRKLSIK